MSYCQQCADAERELATLQARLAACEARCAALESGITSNGCEIVDDAEDALSGEKSGPWVRNIRAEAAEKDAGRYRFWRSTRVVPDDVFGTGFSEGDVDAAIDSAISAGGE